MSLVAVITTALQAGYKQYAYINIVDGVTGKPANGNNIAVSYIQYIANEQPATFTVFVPGQTLTIWVGNFQAGNHWAITTAPVDPDGPPAPPVNRCDLVINTINPDKPESSNGAHDAQITVTASSSYLPIQYSLDNVTWQPAPTFTGLHGGLNTVFCKDANPAGCLKFQSINILTNSNLITSDPSVNINGNISRWNAAFNPIIFTYQRKDFEVVSVAKDSLTGYAKLYINGSMTAVATAYNNNVAISQSGTQGANSFPNIYVYVNAGPYAGVFTVAGADASSITINTPFTVNAYGYININMLRPYYKILTQISYVDPGTNTNTTVISINRPNNNGVVNADISNFLQSILRAKDTSDYTQINFRDANLSASYNIQYAVQYDNYAVPGTTIISPYIAIAETFYVIYAARQLQSKNGGNLAEYVPFPTSLTTAKWLTDFAEPAYSNGYPFDISFIYGETLTGQQLYYNITMLDINRQPIGGGLSSGYLLNDDGSWLLNQDLTKLSISSQTLSSTTIPHQIGLNRLLINNDFPLDAYYFTIAVFYNDINGNPVQLTQTQVIRIDHAPDINAIYMRWIGLTGSWNYYRFNYNQEISLDVQNATIIKNFVQDWQTQDGIEEVISKDAGQKVKLMAEDLSVADIKGLQSIKYSPKVQMLINTNPVTWQTVVLNTATFSEYETINGQAPFSITFNQPSINIQTQ